MPVLHFRPILNSAKDDKTKKFYNCPLYKTSQRAGELSTTGQSTNFILYVPLPIPKSTKGVDSWVI